MTDFLIKSAICQLIFLAIYFLFFEREKMHRFNRFYLLVSIAVSYVIPFINIEIIKEIPLKTAAMENFTLTAATISAEENTNYLPYIIFSVYGLVALLLGFRFWNNILRLIRKMKSSKAIKYQNAKLVLLSEITLPHTFLNTIFINKTDYENRNIEEELYEHELTHVRQKHTLDILFLETLKMVFWFNPLLHFYKKAIRLNHEFLADEKVVESYNDVPFYQKLLLSKANVCQTYYLASNLNYSVTKKRLIMMTKTTSKIKSAFYKLALVPVLIALIFTFCIETAAQEKPALLAQNLSEKPSNEKRDYYYAGVRIIVKNNDGKIIIDKKYEELTEAEKDRFLFYVPSKTIKKSPTKEQFEDFKNAKKYAIWIDNRNVPNSELDKFKPSEIAYFSGSSVFKNARTKKHPQPFQFSFFTHAHFDKNDMGKEQKKFSGEKIEMVFRDSEKPVKSNDAASLKGDKKISKENRISENETQPEFPGGIGEFLKYFSTNFKIPATFKGEGKMIVSFTVETNGSLSKIKILKEAGENTGTEAIRVLENSPKWKPGTKDGKVVKTEFTLPVHIKDK